MIGATAKIMPVVRKQHQLLVTLLLCNAAAMEVRFLVILRFTLLVGREGSDVLVSFFYRPDNQQ